MAPIQQPPMPKYQCHKIVEALKIFDVVPFDNGGASLFPHDPRFAPVEVDAAWMAKHNPQPADPGLQTRGYFVRYEDGYTSWSPIEPFEAGYSLIG
jgi:hypothetical protein